MRFDRFCNMRSRNRPRIYDVFLFNMELDMLEVKLAETSRYVDAFVLLESSISTTGLPKPLYFDEAKPRYSGYAEKIVHLKLNTSGPGPDTWAREYYQRNQLFTGLRDVRDGDVVIVTDVDEIIRPEVLRTLKECSGYSNGNLQFDMHLFYYAYNLRHPNPWSVKGTVWNSTHNLTAQDLRGAAPQSIKHTFCDSGWHCSCCFSTIRDIRNKMHNYGHTDITANLALYTKEHIVSVVRRGEDLYDRADQKYAFIENLTDVPKFVLSNAVRFSFMLDRRIPSAGFHDFNDTV
jgi:beta-1,4-mannosyl-glycoprotein beta-1,4-N-acetylglucosaminyltransferase